MSSVVVDGLPKDLAGAKALFKKDPFEFQYWVLDLVNAMPAQSKSREKMRGADRGIDGVITIVKDVRNSEKQAGRLIVQVKGGKTERSNVATLRGDVEREKTEGGILITLEEPTRPMQQEAVSSGTYTLPYAPSKEFPRIQILTVKELLAGRKLDIPLWSEPYYKQAQKSPEKPRGKQKPLSF